MFGRSSPLRALHFNVISDPDYIEVFFFFSALVSQNIIPVNDSLSSKSLLVLCLLHIASGVNTKTYLNLVKTALSYIVM